MISIPRGLATDSLLWLFQAERELTEAAAAASDKTNRATEGE
jgi:hypothetical protein